MHDGVLHTDDCNNTTSPRIAPNAYKMSANWKKAIETKMCSSQTLLYIYLINDDRKNLSIPIG